MINNPEFEKYPNGEDFCWNARVGIGEFVENYRLTKNADWLKRGVEYFDFLIKKTITDPDGYQGWIGVYGDDVNYWQDALAGEAILYDGILGFAIQVMEDKKLEKIFSGKANYYIQFAKKNFIEKWDKRGCWVEDGIYGTYIGYNKFLNKNDLSKWIRDDGARGAGISHPFNKQLDAALVSLKLFRLTNEKFYRDRAEKIFLTFKSHFQYFDNHYCWNYFEPLYPGDVDLANKTTRHGVWVHMWRSGYQADEVVKIVEAYHNGIVFNETDIKRIINTNLNVMWNKDFKNPHFINSNGLGAEFDTVGIAGFQQVYGHSNAVKNGGELWEGLMDFDQRIRDLYEIKLKGNKKSVEYLRYKKEVLGHPPGFQRKYCRQNVPVPEVCFTESADLNLATVLPHTIAENGKVILICQTRIAGELQVDLYSKENIKLNNIYTGKIKEGMFMITWDGAGNKKDNRYNGEYKIRWSIGNGYRESPIIIDLN